jgi:16S rRNA (guanine1516-N2)-methyltransferase
MSSGKQSKSIQPKNVLANSFAIITDQAHKLEAEQWGNRLHIPVIGPDTAGIKVLLRFNKGTLSVQLNCADAPGAVFVDFVNGSIGHRRKFGGGKGQALAKAIGFKGNKNPIVADVTAGLGRDAFVLADLGATVTMIERSPIVAALLENALDRAMLDEELSPWLGQRLNLINADACLALKELATPPEVVYMDPMFPHRSKTALVKKEMRVLREVVGDDDNAEDLLDAGLAVATKRVVVKRPKGAPVIGNHKPSYVLDGKTTRYDIYLSSSHR